MSQTPITVTYSLEEVLGEMKQSLNRIDERLNKIEVEVVEIKTEVKGINKRLDGQEFINRSIAVGILLTFATLHKLLNEGELIIKWGRKKVVRWAMPTLRKLI